MSHQTGFFPVVALLLSCGCGEDRDRGKIEKDKPFGGRPLQELEDELKDRDPKVRLKAVKLLGSGPSRKAVPALCRALADPEPAVAEEAAKRLGWNGPNASAAVPILIQRLKKPPSDGFREAALTALGYIGPSAKTAIPLLIDQLHRKQTPLRSRRAAATALGKMGPVAKEAVPTLIEALAERELEREAVTALIQMGKAARAAVPALGKKLRLEKPYWLDLVRFLADVDPAAARAAIPDLRTVAASEPVRDQGIVNFRQSQQQIEEAKTLLKKLESGK
jgi:hypothetical protein